MTQNAAIETKLPNWLRWILIPVFAAITALLVAIVGNIASKILVFFSDGRGWGDNFFQYLVIPGFSTYCSIKASSFIAPRFKSITAIFIASVWVFGAGVITFFTFLLPMHEWKNLIIVFSVLIGCYFAAIETYEEPTIP
jgi:hypothetical protein